MKVVFAVVAGTFATLAAQGHVWATGPAVVSALASLDFILRDLPGTRASQKGNQHAN